MRPRYIGFDIETAKVVPEWEPDLMAHRPLGIACAAAVLEDRKDPVTWHGTDNDAPAPQMSRDDVRSTLDDLCAWVEDGYTLVTWNGLKFDFDVLSEESDQLQRCAEIALGHIDLMFHAVCGLGHYVSLPKAAEGLGLGGKTSGMTGAQAPVLWSQGKYDQVLEYNIQDARLALKVAQESERRGEFLWITGRGRTRGLYLDDGWLCVRDACRLPLPDTSWMTDPPCRDQFFAWLPPELLT